MCQNATQYSSPMFSSFRLCPGPSLSSYSHHSWRECFLYLLDRYLVNHLEIKVSASAQIRLDWTGLGVDLPWHFLKMKDSLLCSSTIHWIGNGSIPVIQWFLKDKRLITLFFVSIADQWIPRRRTIWTIPINFLMQCFIFLQCFFLSHLLIEKYWTVRAIDMFGVSHDVSTYWMKTHLDLFINRYLSDFYVYALNIQLTLQEVWYLAKWSIKRIIA